MPEDLTNLALDLTVEFPRSPRALFAGYVIVGRVLDKCRAMVNGTEASISITTESTASSLNSPG